MNDRDDRLIVVDEQDRVLEFLSREECHAGEGILHRAFSVFLFDPQGRLLLQKRSAGKPLWPGSWSNSCCSHPRVGETIEDAAHRRLAEELGVGATLEFAFRFSYQATDADRGSERELCSVFLGRSTDTVRGDPDEIEAVRFVTRDELSGWMQEQPQTLTPWFKLEWQLLEAEHTELLARYFEPA